jgi:putative phosphonate catabolism associated alcohol dehydrogenase
VTRAAVFRGVGEPLRVESFARPVLGPGEALVRVSLATICGSDLHTIYGRRPGPTPCVLGHEAVGVVEDVGPGFLDVSGRPVTVGERVVWGVAAACGGCFFCRVGLPQKCDSLRKYGHDPVRPGSGPHGSLTTRCHLLPGTAVVRVPDHLSDAVAAPAACATATVMAALAAGPVRGCVVVFGVGMLGLTACAAAAETASAVVACDVDDARLSRARAFGATHTCRPAEVVDLARALTAGRGADLALELSGSPAAVGQSLDVLRPGGTAVWVGAVSPSPAVPIDPERVVRRCLRVVGVHNYAPPDLAAAVAFLSRAHARFPFAGLVERTFDLDDADAAVRYAGAVRPVRVGVTPRCGTAR